MHPTLAKQTGIRAGLRAAIPMAIASFPFGLAYGVAVVAAPIDQWVGASASWLVLAGAAQLSMLELIGSRASWVIVIATGLVINARFALYSAALAPAFASFPPRWRFTLPYCMTDQAAALSLQFFAGEPDPVARRWFYLSTGLVITAFYWIGTLTGIAAGAALPASLDIGFVVPLVFIVLIVPTVIDRPAVIAVLVAGGVTLATRALPHGSNILLGRGRRHPRGGARRPGARMTPLAQFAVAGLGTYLLRLSAIALVGQGVVIPPRVERTLRLIAPAVLSAIVANSLILNAGQFNPRVSWYVGAIVAALVVWRARSMAWAMLAAFVAVWGLQGLGVR
ncbi:MAG: AzlC family ABC transporter permease [Vicinamibacterales bacterium]